MKHIETDLEPMYYYDSEHVVMGKRGDGIDFRDIFLYREDQKSWRKYTAKDKFYMAYFNDIFRNSRSISREEVTERGIPLIEDSLPDVTTQIFEEAREAEEQNK